MGRKACEVVESGELKIIPEQHKKIWYNFMRGTQDWCISRQLWLVSLNFNLFAID
jgi:valyl-tRNA synthetase